ncbi:hypothetical protein M5K25_003631 [Dendrobium thyrsiflorum]|uniref:Reverse transcriptase zinc-binding domain-containing protein n=1 Tax=Dendrobium thyrsiflorum TaxID=117978 RepID=A0ABD0VKN2_DENTH
MAVPSPSNPWFPSKESTSRSFKEVLEGSSSVAKIDFVHSTVKGIPALLIDDSIVTKLAAPFSFTLVGKFMLRRPNIDIIRKFFFNLKLSAAFSVGLMDQKHIAIQLSNDLDYSRIFSRRVYYIMGCQMRLLKWTPDFDVREESPIAPVWISFPNLRLHFFNNQVLFALASIFGRPLQTDQATSLITRPSVARVLVELDVSKKQPKEVWLGSEMNGYFQKVVFENLPSFCAHCKMHGHLMSDCFILHPTLRNIKDRGQKLIINKDGETNTGSDPPILAPDSIVLHCPLVEGNVDIGNNDQGYADTQEVNIVGKDGEKENFDEQMLALLKPDGSLSKMVPTENKFDLLLCADLLPDNSNVQNMGTEESIEEGELVGSPIAMSSVGFGKEHSTKDQVNSDKFLIWNIRGIGCPSSRIRVKNLCRIHNISLLVILEPFISVTKLGTTSSTLGFKHSYANITNKIWVMWKDSLAIDIVGDFNQVLHCHLKISNLSLYASFIYASSFYLVRKHLWKSLTDFCDNIDGPWFVGGDFNAICNSSERLGGRPPNPLAMDDFNNMIMECSLFDVGFSGNTFTWNRGCMWQRLDRILFNSNWVNSLYNTAIEHLSNTLSDHSPLLMSFQDCQSQVGFSFRFQNMWLLNEDFLSMVMENWEAPIFPNNEVCGMKRLWLKLKRLKYKLVWWNKTVFKNIFSNILIAEDLVNKLDSICQKDPSTINSKNLQDAKNSLFLLQDQEEVFWRQKAASKHLLDGDRNTKYFHAVVKNNRARSFINKIIDGNGNDIEGSDNIANSAGRKKSFLFDDLITSIRKKLTSWDFHLLSFGGRLTLIKSVLSSFPIYKFQTMFPTNDVCNRVEILFNKFFWRGKSNSSKIIWSSWSKCCGAIKEGAFGCKSLGELAHAFSCKLWFKFRTQKCVWSQFMLAKYCGDKHPSLSTFKKGDSRVWNRLCGIKWQMEPLIRWDIGNANMFLWQDIWMDNISIDHLLNTISISTTKVKDFINDGNWDIDKLADNLPDWIVQRILNSPINLENEDKLMFALTNTTSFSIKKIWNHFRTKLPSSKIYSMIWHRNIPMTVSVFLWRLLHNFIPSDDLLIDKGFYVVSKCQCCFHVENIAHIFVSGPIAVKLWVHFQGIFNVNLFNPGLSIRDLIIKWFSKDNGHITHLVCALIVWNLWVARNCARFNGTSMEANKRITLIQDKVNRLYKVKMLANKHFKGFNSSAVSFGIFIS